MRNFAVIFCLGLAACTTGVQDDLETCQSELDVTSSDLDAGAEVGCEVAQSQAVELVYLVGGSPYYCYDADGEQYAELLGEPLTPQLSEGVVADSVEDTYADCFRDAFVTEWQDFCVQ